MHIWFKLLDGAGIPTIIIEGKIPIKKLYDSYFKIMDEYKDLMGTPPEFINSITNAIKLEVANIKLMKGDRFQQNIINMLEIDLKEGEVKENRRSEEIAAISKFIGFRLNPLEETVESYCGYILMIRKNGNN